MLTKWPGISPRLFSIFIASPLPTLLSDLPRIYKHRGTESYTHSAPQRLAPFSFSRCYQHHRHKLHRVFQQFYPLCVLLFRSAGQKDTVFRFSQPAHRFIPFRRVSRTFTQLVPPFLKIQVPTVQTRISWSMNVSINKLFMSAGTSSGIAAYGDLGANCVSIIYQPFLFIFCLNHRV